MEPDYLVGKGPRVKNDTTLHDSVKTDAPPHRCRANGRVVKCDGGDWDVLECSVCGEQWEARCNFDDDYS